MDRLILPKAAKHRVSLSMKPTVFPLMSIEDSKSSMPPAELRLGVSPLT
jgi:hypothetical protein